VSENFCDKAVVLIFSRYKEN